MSWYVHKKLVNMLYWLWWSLHTDFDKKKENPSIEKLLKFCTNMKLQTYEL